MLRKIVFLVQFFGIAFLYIVHQQATCLEVFEGWLQTILLEIYTVLTESRLRLLV